MVNTSTDPLEVARERFKELQAPDCDFGRACKLADEIDYYLWKAAATDKSPAASPPEPGSPEPEVTMSSEEISEQMRDMLINYYLDRREAAADKSPIDYSPLDPEGKKSSEEIAETIREIIRKAPFKRKGPEAMQREMAAISKPTTREEIEESQRPPSEELLARIRVIAAARNRDKGRS